MNNFFAAIDIGSYLVKFKIVQYIHQEVIEIEHMHKAVNIGEDVCRQGVVGTQSINRLLECLVYFKKIVKTYDITHCRVVATGAMCEAKNSDNVLDLIYMKTNLKVEILEDAQEKFLTYKSLRDKEEDYFKIRKSGMLIEVNSQSCDLSIYQRNRLIYNEEWDLGKTKLIDTLKQLEEKTLNYTHLLDAYVKAEMSIIEKEVHLKKINHCLAAGHIKPIEAYFKGVEVSTDDFKTLYEDILHSPRETRKSVEASGLPWYKLATLVILYYNFFKMTKSTGLVLSKINLLDGLLAESIERTYGLTKYHMFNKDPLYLARAISKKYTYNKASCSLSEKNSTALFLALAEEYPFHERELLYLKISAHLHEIGKYTTLKAYQESTYDKIKNLHLLGMTKEEMILIATICFNIGAPDTGRFDRRHISQDHQRSISKLSAILTVTKALDISKMQNIKIEHAKIEKQNLCIFIVKKGDCSLEELAFEKNKNKFEYTYGLKPILKEH